MKKRILTVAVAALALSACSKNETVEVADSNLIGFNAFVGNATRAGLPVDQQFGSSRNISQFFVFGNTATETVFDEVRVYNQNNQWVYDELKQWQNGQTYKFVAYSVTDKNGLPAERGTASFNYADHVLSIDNYESNDNYQRDLVVAASTEDLKSANVQVPFIFKHALAMIKFTLGSSLGDKNPITITDFKVEGMHTTGDVTVTVGATGEEATIAWTNQAVEDPAVPFTDDTWTQVTTTIPVASDEFVVIPQNLSGNITVTFTASVVGLGEKTLTATIANPIWEVGKRYNYSATITGLDLDVIEFAAPVVEDWGIYTDMTEDID